MSRIKNKDTIPEKAVRSILHSLGFGYRLHDSSLPGKPDIVLKKYKTLIFVHGCFWHRHQGCKYAYTPKTRQDFWEKKFSQNVMRAEKVEKELSALGWIVLIIWECEIADAESLKEKLIHSLGMSPE